MSLAFVVLYDASVLYPSTLRDLLIRIAQAGLVQAKWTDQILDEVFVALARNRPDLHKDRLDRTRGLMLAAVRDCLVKGYEPLIPSLELPDAGDRHVLAAAIRARAQLLVTANLRHFPTETLLAWNIVPRSPDDFLCDQIDLDRQIVYGAVLRIADSRNKPSQTVDDVLNSLERAGCPRAVAELRSG